jgi:hypothetical protein
VIDKQHIFRLLLDRPRDPLPVLCSEEECAQDEEVERPLQEGNAFIAGLSGGHST